MTMPSSVTDPNSNGHRNPGFRNADEENDEGGGLAAFGKTALAVVGTVGEVVYYAGVVCAVTIIGTTCVVVGIGVGLWLLGKLGITPGITITFIDALTNESVTGVEPEAPVTAAV